MPHDPLSPAEALRTRVGAVLTAVSLLVFVYSLLIVGQFLLGMMVLLVLTVGLYLAYRTFAALDALADAAQRIADAREREVERESGFGAAAEREGSSADRVAERDR
jgi:cobalamin synthase